MGVIHVHRGVTLVNCDGAGHVKAKTCRHDNVFENTG